MECGFNYLDREVISHALHGNSGLSAMQSANLQWLGSAVYNLVVCEQMMSCHLDIVNVSRNDAIPIIFCNMFPNVSMGGL